MFRLVALLLIPLAFASGSAAAGGGPAPGVVTGWDGVVDRAQNVRYVAMPTGRTTIVAAVRRSDGRVLRYVTVNGSFGIPLVAFDGTADGISHDGRTLVVADIGIRADQTTFVFLNTTPLRILKRVTLQGRWAFDALSPDGRTIYAIQYLTADPNPRYNVRAISLLTGKPLGGAIVDKREPDEEMNGAPWARARSATAPGLTRSMSSRAGPRSFTRSTRLGGGRSVSTCRGNRRSRRSRACGSRSSWAVERSSCRSAAKGVGWRSSTRRRSR